MVHNMQLDEELPESLEELEKEIEELEKAEISPPPEAAKKRKEPTAPGEKKFSIASIFLGFFVLFGVTFAMLYISISNLLSLLGAGTVDATQQLIFTIFLSLATLPTYPNVLTQVITGNIGLSPPPDITSDIVILALSIITLVAYSATISSDPYVLLVVVGIVPYLLAGLIAGIKNKELSVLQLYQASKILFFWMNNKTVSRMNGTVQIKAVPDKEGLKRHFKSF